MAIAYFTELLSIIDWLEDTSERGYMTLTKSTPLGEECGGF